MTSGCHVIPILRPDLIGSSGTIAVYAGNRKNFQKEIDMKGHEQALEFLKKSQVDRDLSQQVSAAVQKGGLVTAEEVMEIAKKAGYSFTRSEFETAVRGSIEERFKAGEQGLASMVKVKQPLESSCAKGCLSYTTNWHP